jgi:PIN domain nuclease of toxin-antitoxin system
LKLLLDTHIVIWAALDPAAVVAFAAAIDWELLPLTPRHAAAELIHPLGHKDPFDELLLIQAQEEGMRLLTRDTKLIGHPFAVAGGQE